MQRICVPEVTRLPPRGGGEAVARPGPEQGLADQRRPHPAVARVGGRWCGVAERRAEASAASQRATSILTRANLHPLSTGTPARRASCWTAKPTTNDATRGSVPFIHSPQHTLTHTHSPHLRVTRLSCAPVPSATSS